MVKNSLDSIIKFEDFSSMQCYLCGFQAEMYLDMSRHLLEEHNFDSDVLDFISLEVCSSKSARSSSVSTSEQNECPYCFKQFLNYRGMRQHVGKAHHNKNKCKKCNLCGGKFKDKYALNYHHRQVHGDSQKVKCPNCHLLIYNKYMYQKHLTKCTPKA